MKIYSILILLFLACPLLTSAHDCDIMNRVQPNGAMIFFMRPEKFYETKNKTLHGTIATDGDQFYLILFPNPMPGKSVARKISGDLEVRLQNDSSLTLKHFDSQFIQEDTVLALYFEIDKKSLDLLIKNPVDQVKLDLGGPDKELYTFMLHKEALQQQLICFMDRKPKSKKKT